MSLQHMVLPLLSSLRLGLRTCLWGNLSKFPRNRCLCLPHLLAQAAEEAGRRALGLVTGKFTCCAWLCTLFLPPAPLKRHRS